MRRVRSRARAPYSPLLISATPADCKVDNGTAFRGPEGGEDVGVMATGAGQREGRVCFSLSLSLVCERGVCVRCVCVYVCVCVFEVCVYVVT